MKVKVLRAEDQTLDYEDFEIGDEFTTPMITLTETHLVLFSSITGDFNLGHTCEHYCNKLSGDLGGGTRMIQGLLGLSVGVGLFQRMGISAYLEKAAYLGIDQWRFIHPIKIGDSIGCKVEVLEKKVWEKKPEWGFLRMKMTIINQNDEVIQTGEHLIAIGRKDRDK